MMPPVHYHLNAFPPRDLDWRRLVGLVGQANAALARFDGLVEAIPNANILLSPLTTQEAVLSSRIEGTQVTMGEVLEFEAGAEPVEANEQRRNDAEEVRNYRTALLNAASELETRTISLHVLRQTHALLLSGVRGVDKSPGEFRSEQNWIGAPNCPIEEASFVPIPQAHLIQGLETWEAEAVREQPDDSLVQLALLHLEFEALHPFKDGNGRLGRMLIPLYLAQQKLLRGPYFYMSGYLEERKEEYIMRMRDVSEFGAWTEWCAFFLEGIVEQAAVNQAKAQRILSLHQEMLHRVSELTHSQYAPRAVDYLFSRPVFPSSTYVEDSGIPRPTALRILGVLRDADILTVIRPGSGRRPAVHAFGALINISEGRDLF